jgi:hypothetical protein
MKVNQLGALAIIGVVVSFTAACDGSPTKPTAAFPPPGDAASAASVSVSSVLPIGAIEPSCTDPTETTENRDPSDGGPNSLRAVTCDSSAAVEEPQGDVVVSDPLPMETARFARRLHR